MNITQLRTFVAVVERGSFSEAARFLGVSQPAVTMQIQALESDAGATLLDRQYRRVALTDAGRALLPYARRVLAEIEDARAEIESVTGSVTGRLAIGASTTPGDYVIPRLLGSFLAAYPEVGVTVQVHDTAEVVEAIEAGHVHFGITGSQVRGARVSFEEIGRDELVIIAAPDSPLISGASTAALASATWIMREQGSGTRLVTQEALAEHGLDVDELKVAVELGSGEAIVSAVEGALGIAMLSRLVVAKALELGTVAEVRLDWLPVVRPFYAVMPKGTPTRPALAFAEHLRAALAQ